MSVRIVLPPADLLESGADAVVLPVNCVGVPGKGLALAAAKRWPDWAAAYRADCRAGGMKPGRVYCTLGRGSALPPPHAILSFTTKDHWRDPSQVAWIEGGLRCLAAFCRGWSSRTPRTVAVPALGCGLGELAWDDVRPLAEKILVVPGVEFLLYAPHEAPRPRAAGRR